MLRRKARAEVRVADGAGGMAPLRDLRFDPGEWPVEFEIRDANADTWMRYLVGECEARGWSTGGLGQLQRHENSGTKTVFRAGRAVLTLVWERKRGDVLKVRARPEAADEFPVADVSTFFDRINTRCAASQTERFYRCACLEYAGLPWRGELWLDDNLRLGPPSRLYNGALNGPQAVVVTAMVEAVSPGDSAYVFQKELSELAAFLSVVMATNVCHRRQDQMWTWEIADDGQTICGVRHLGYIEMQPPSSMPARHSISTVPFAPVRRRTGLETEVSLPADIVELWSRYRALPPDRKTKFRHVAAKWQEALMHWQERDTLSFTLMVVACEALKHSGSEFRDHKIEHVATALLGPTVGELLKRDWFRAHYVRSEHLHLGKMRGEELSLGTMVDYRDPTFDEARRELFRITNAAIIEWLRRDGNLMLSPLRRTPKTLRNLVRQNAVPLLVIALMTGAVIGFAVGFIF
jgi:hypothetical protein